jgi:hypothetical protein
MKMKEYKLKVLSQYRAFFGFVASIMIPLLWLGQSFGHFEPSVRILTALAILAASFYLFIYLFSYGRLTIFTDGKTIKFDWQKKNCWTSKDITTLKLITYQRLKLTIHSKAIQHS